MNAISCDVAVIGAGAAGLTAGRVCADFGLNVLILDREDSAGGVLRQCIHNGFGVHYFKEELTGPEYAERLLRMAQTSGAILKTGATVERIDEADGKKRLLLYSKNDGVSMITAKAVVLAMGCRERCRGNIGTPGDRLAGVFTAGLAQRLLNMEGLLPGKSAVIVGSGDIGLIMARRLSWCGVRVKGVLEILPHPSGLSRNIAQCLEDFNIPLYLSTAVTGIYGKDRVERVTAAPLKDGMPDRTREWSMDCDTVLFSVGLIPENELSAQCGVVLNPVTRGAVVDSRLMTSVPGIFSCGNVLHVHDLADYVSEEATRCAEGVRRYLREHETSQPGIPVSAGENLRYVVPNRCEPGTAIRFYLRSFSVCSRALLRISGNGFEKKIPLRYVKPAEMIRIELSAAETARMSATGGGLCFHLEIQEA